MFRKSFPEIMYIIRQHLDQKGAIRKIRINVFFEKIIWNTISQAREHLEAVVLVQIRF